MGVMNFDTVLTQQHNVNRIITNVNPYLITFNEVMIYDAELINYFSFIFLVSWF